MRKANFKNDEDLLKALQGSNKERNAALDYFFQNPMLLQWVLRHVQFTGGNLQDGKDVFEEAFIIFERQLRTGHFKGESSLITFFHGIARWKWYGMRRKNKGHTDLDNMPEMPDTAPNPEKLLISEERRVILSQLIAQIGERCQKLLGYYQLNYKMKEIREKMQFSSNQVAANEVHACRKKLKKVIENNPEYEAILKNRN